MEQLIIERPNFIIGCGLMFDVETKNGTTEVMVTENLQRLWFDVETKNGTTQVAELEVDDRLWFDVETKTFGR